MNRYIKSFSIASILYVGIFVSFLYSFENNAPLQNKQTKSEELVKFTIIQESAPKPAQKMVEKKPKPIIKKVVKKEKTTKKIKPIVKKKKEIIRKIVKKQTIKKEKQVKKVIHKKSETIVKKQIKKNKSTVVNNKKHLENSHQKKMMQQKYYSSIKEAINKNKSYPRVAVKRGIEGIVEIQFTISKEGKLLSFHIIEGKSVFKKSISDAVKNSFPLTPPKGILTSNKNLSLKIDYRLY
ncbi:hypothetical protein ALC152_17810 [Arcobacter sp. 15-2]|uniref:energy transducer TonB n=1 Tax=Arcobacter sp. 15-2 TaxID=3374109 RepID=UPI00399CF055